MLRPVARETGRPGHRISLRVSDELFKRINELAKRDRRTLAQWVRQRLEDSAAVAPPPASGGRKRAQREGQDPPLEIAPPPAGGGRKR
jgi:hypothetical protein